MDKTGARWSVAGAEAVLRLRALRTNGDFDDYWHHVAAEFHALEADEARRLGEALIACADAKG